MDSIGINSLARHIPQFAVRDCDRLILVLREWLKVPPPEIKIIITERDSIINILRKNKGDNQKLYEFFAVSSSDDDEPTPPSKLQKVLENLDADTHSIVEGAIEKITKLYNDSIENLKLPFWKRTQARLVDDGSLAYEMAEHITMTPSTISDRYMQVLAQMQLLTVHAAIRKFRWENDRLPTALEELKRERDEGFLTDPFTGDLLIYKPNTDGERYELYSTGIPERDETGKIKPNSGKPIYMPTPKRPASP